MDGTGRRRSQCAQVYHVSWQCGAIYSVDFLCCRDSGSWHQLHCGDHWFRGSGSRSCSAGKSVKSCRWNPDPFDETVPGGRLYCGNRCRGTVRNIDIFYTRIVTTDNKVVVIPNGTLSNGNIINTSQEDYRLLILDFMVGYDADISKVREIILELMEQDMQICQDRARSVNIDKLNPGRVKLQAKAWVATEHYWDVRYRMLEKIKEELPKQGISLF
ncbi:mechanosensitive ion channel family protein [Clostridium sp. OM07-10AC]|nr:mechanosensitive ion channel family protein [Clostridium sp. OM07-9AC]RHV07903.1 mechanosensitive ion channel family protein [Clostridium sp. OM07-10AC]